MSLQRHDVPFILLIGGIIAYGFALAIYTVAGSDVFGLVTLNGDDAFYYFQVARNTAEGHFSSFDGGITRTNGYHPLWMFLLVPLFLAFDAESALFAIKFLEILVLASGIALVVLAARLARLPWPPLIAVPLAIFPQRSFLIGMEPALALFMLALLFVALALWARDCRMAAPVAALLFLLPWARTEYVAISLTVAAALFVIERSWRRAGFRESLLPLAGALSGFAAYLAYNQLVFGGAVPVSGAVKHAWSQELWDALGGFDLARNFLLVSRERWIDNLAALAVCVAAVPVWRRLQRSDSAGDRFFVVIYAGVFGLAAGHLAKLAQTVLFMHPKFGIYTTYFVPGDLMMPLLAAVVWRLAAKSVGRVARGGGGAGRSGRRRGGGRRSVRSSCSVSARRRRARRPGMEMGQSVLGRHDDNEPDAARGERGWCLGCRYHRLFFALSRRQSRRVGEFVGLFACWRAARSPNDGRRTATGFRPHSPRQRGTGTGNPARQRGFRRRAASGRRFGQRFQTRVGRAFVCCARRHRPASGVLGKTGTALPLPAGRRRRRGGRSRSAGLLQGLRPGKAAGEDVHNFLDPGGRRDTHPTLVPGTGREKKPNGRLRSGAVAARQRQLSRSRFGVGRAMKAVDRAAPTGLLLSPSFVPMSQPGDAGRVGSGTPVRTPRRRRAGADGSQRTESGLPSGRALPAPFRLRLRDDIAAPVACAEPFRQTARQPPRQRCLCLLLRRGAQGGGAGSATVAARGTEAAA